MDYTMEKDLTLQAERLRQIVRNMIVGVILLALGKGLLWLLVSSNFAPDGLKLFLKGIQIIKDDLSEFLIAAPLVLFGISFISMTAYSPQNKFEVIQYRMQRKAKFYQMFWSIVFAAILIFNIPI